MKDDSLNITTKTMITFSLFLDGKVVLESDDWIGGVQMTVAESDVEKVISQAALFKELAQKNRPKKK